MLGSIVQEAAVIPRYTSTMQYLESLHYLKEKAPFMIQLTVRTYIECLNSSYESYLIMSISSSKTSEYRTSILAYTPRLLYIRLL